MNVHQSPSIVLSGGAGDRGRLYYDNVVTQSSLLATEEAAGEPASNAWNPSTYLKWRGLTAVAQSLRISLAAPALADYIAIAGHNLGTARITVTFEVSMDGVTYSTLGFPSAPADDSVIILEFPQEFSRYFRMSFSAGTAPPAIGVVYLGRKLVLQRGIYVGHTPITLGRNTVVSNGRSESGQFLGRVLRRETFMSRVEMGHITAQWYRANMPAFVTASSAAPFFWRWRPGAYPAEAGYAWLTDDLTVSNQLPNGMMQFAFQMQAIK